MPAMNTPWKQRWQRLAHMDRAELADRVRQHFAARVDAMRYRAGFRFGEDVQNAGPNSEGSFFFAPDAVPALCSLLKHRFPREVELIVRRAERIVEHRFDLLGYEDLNYGTRIAWHHDLVHQKQAPRRPWYQIHYLDFDEVGDSKVTWELNRHQHFVTLAKAYRLTGEEGFAREIFAQWQDWHVENPYPIGINWASSLEVAFRSLSWIWTYFLLAGSDIIPPDFRRQWLRALSVSGRHIECYLSTYFSPNTHLLGEAVALFFIGMACPQLRSAKRWKEQGWQTVLRESARQVQRDGLHFEQSLYYHVYALDFFLHAGILANLNEIAVPATFDATLERMLEALCLLTRAGTPPRLGDDDGGRLFAPYRNRAEHLSDPLATGAVVFGRGDFKRVANGLREETLWLLGEQGVAEFDRLQESALELNSTALPEAGLYFMTGPGQQLVLDAGLQGASTAGHGHADALSVCVSSNSRSLLIDPGTCEYVGEDRQLFRSTAFHNTMSIDGKGQAQPNGPFSWKRVPNVHAEAWVTGQTFDLFVGSHDGYAPVTHRRWVFSLKGRFWLIRDMALGEGERALDLFWHVSAELSQQNEAFVDQQRGDGFRFLTVEGTDWRRRVEPGWWSPVYGQKENATVLHFATVAKLPSEFVTLLVPTAQTKPGILTRVASKTGGAGECYRYQNGNDDDLMVFRGRNEPWTVAQWSSDAEFLYVGRHEDRRHLIVCNGSYVEVNGNRIVSAAAPLLRCEILTDERSTRVFCSDEDAVVMKNSIRTIWPEAGAVVPISGSTVS